jgi:hypothetical protein
MDQKENFMIEDLDDHHIVIKAEHEWRVRQELEVEVRCQRWLRLSCLFFCISAGEEYLQRGLKGRVFCEVGKENPASKFRWTDN